jgi:Flagellin and related hook-associated proteins
MRVNQNPIAYGVWKEYTKNVFGMNRSMEKLATGLRIVSAADDPARLGISEQLRGMIRRTDAALNNIQDKIGFIQTAEGWLQNVHDILNKMGDLATTARNETLTDTERANLQTEFSQLQQQLRMIGSGPSQLAQYANQIIFSSRRIMIQVGPQAEQTFTVQTIPSFGAITALNRVMSSGITLGIGISTISRAGEAIAQIINAIGNISRLRATLGAEQNRIEFMMNGTNTYYQNLMSTESRIRDVDVAKETSEFTRRQILVQSSIAMLAQANILPQNVLALLGGGR